MILVDTSVWIDHLHDTEQRLVELLEADEVAGHEYVVEELVLGSIQRRRGFIGLLQSLAPFPILSHEELLALVESRQLWGRGLSAIDAHLIGAVLLVPSAILWTRDKRLEAVAADLEIPLLSE